MTIADRDDDADQVDAGSGEVTISLDGITVEDAEVATADGETRVVDVELGGMLRVSVDADTTDDAEATVTGGTQAA